MAKCECGCQRLLKVDAKCRDLCYTEALPSGDVSEGYAPRDIGIGGGDYIRFTICLFCGKIQDWKTVPHYVLLKAQGDC